MCERALSIAARSAGVRRAHHLWRQHSANLAHAIITSAQAVLVVSHGNPADGGEELTYDAMVFSTAATKRAFAVALGFFLWDLAMELRAPKLDVPVVLHAVFCCSAYFTGLYLDALHYIGCCCLCYELSSIALNVRYLMLHSGAATRRPILFNAVQLCFVTFFFLVRLCFGLPTSWHWLRRVALLLWRPGGWPAALPAALGYALLVLNGALNSLNLFWFVGIMRRMRRPRKSA